MENLIKLDIVNAEFYIKGNEGKFDKNPNRNNKAPARPRRVPVGQKTNA